MKAALADDAEVETDSVLLQEHGDGGITDIELKGTFTHVIMEAKRGLELPGMDQLIVTQTVTLTVGEGSKKRELSAAVTLVVVDDGGTPKIAHMHWSLHEVAEGKK